MRRVSDRRADAQTAIDIEGLPGNRPACIGREMRTGPPDIVDRRRMPGRRPGFGPRHQAVEIPEARKARAPIGDGTGIGDADDEALFTGKQRRRSEFDLRRTIHGPLVADAGDGLMTNRGIPPAIQPKTCRPG